MTPKFKVKLTTKNFNSDQQKKIEAAAKIVEECFNSDYFRAAVLNKMTLGKPFFHYTNDSRDTVYKKLMAGAEVLDQTEDFEADIFVELDNSFSWSAIGYTYPNTKWQWIYNRFFKGASIEAIAGNLAHEWCHKIGYEHEFKYTRLREHSVPYWVGNFVESYSNAGKTTNYFERFKKYFE